MGYRAIRSEWGERRQQPKKIRRIRCQRARKFRCRWWFLAVGEQREIRRRQGSQRQREKGGRMCRL